MAQSSLDRLRTKAELLSAHKRYWLDRFIGQIEFAQGLAKIMTSKTRTWGKLIEQAIELVAAAADSGKADRVDKAVQQAEELLAPLARSAKGYTIHCVGHAHIDMNWLWSWPETVAVTNDTFTTILALMDEHPDFCFSQSQASCYEIVRQYAPDLLEPIRRRVAEGRWEVTAVHWVEGEKNLSSGESLARHLLYTRRYMKDMFGLEPEDVKIDWDGDMFGHAWTIPSILVRGAATRYYMCRPGMPEKPWVFWWRGPDGSRVLVFRDRGWYNGQIGPYLTPLALDFFGSTGIKDFLWSYGMGDHGGGPTCRDIARCHDMDAWPVYPKVKLATTRKFYDILEANGEKWPVIDGELNFEFTGCYTTQTMIKRGNRYGENYCVEAETAAALALRGVGRAYPRRELREAWIDVLFGQFHDILPGSGVHWTREYQVGLFQKIAAATGMVKTHSWRALAGAVDTSFAAVEAPKLPPQQVSMAMGAGAGRNAMLGDITCATHTGDGPRPFVVFNSCAWGRREVVQASIWDADTGMYPGDLKAKKFVVRTADGREFAAQRVNAGNYWGHNFVDVVFPTDVPALGWATYVIDEGTAEPAPGAVTTYDAPTRHEPHGITNFGIENEHVAVEFDGATGGVTKLLDKATGVDLADPARPMAILEYVLERARGMSAWLIGQTQRRECPLDIKSLDRGQNGPYLATVVAKLRVHESDVTITYALKAGQAWLDVGIEATWFERGTKETGIPSLRMAFPLALEQAKGVYEIPFGTIARDLNQGQEVPSLRWAEVAGQAPAGGDAGCLLMNDCKYGHSLDGSTLRLTLIRSSYEPDPLPEIGEHQVRLALAPHGRRLEAAEMIRLGAGFNHPLQVVATSVHGGTLPVRASAVTAVEPASLVFSSMKRAEDGEALIVRLFEANGQAARATVTLDPKLMGKVEQAVEVDLLERPLAAGTARAEPDGFSVDVPAFGIASVKLTLARQ